MAVTASGLFLLTEKDIKTNSTPIDILTDVMRMALYTNSLTPNFSSNTGYGASPFTSNEVTGAGYTAKGVALAGKTFAESPTGTLRYDANDPAWSSATISGVRCGLVFDDTVTTPVADPVIALVNFGADFAVTAGTLTVILDTLGIWYEDLTP